MTITLIGAGLGRTGTMSLKLALERLLDGTCHHMAEVGAHPDEIPVWHGAMNGEPVDWPTFLGGYEAIVDYPGAAVWRELAEAFPDAPVLLSTRASTDAWFASADATIFAISRDGDHDDLDDTAAARHAMVQAMFARNLTPDWREPAVAKAAYEAHNQAVRDTIDRDRLFEYQPGDGWGPLCSALGVAEPDEPFPHTNTTAEYRSFTGLDESSVS